MTLVLETRNLRKQYMLGSVPVDALRGVDLAIRSGEFVAILGPSGSGKSTLLNMLGVLDRPTEGTVLVDGVDTSTLKDSQRVELRRKIGFVFQFFNLIPRLSAIENVELPLNIINEPHMSRRQRAGELLQDVGLEERTDHKPSELSGGERQRVAIARALANKPQFLLLDEPTGNIDSKTASELLDLISRLNKEQGVTIVMITHDSLIADYAQRTIRLLDGRIDGERSK